MRGVTIRYYAYRATVSVGFTAPVWYLYLIETTSFGVAGVLQAVWWIGLVVFEIPTGYVADRIGRRGSLIVGNVGLSIAYAWIAAATGAIDLGAAFLLAAAVSTFRTGADDAWLYEVLQTELSGDAFTRVRGRGDAVMFVTSGATAVVGGYLADATTMGTTFLATGVVSLLAVPVVLGFPTTEDDSGVSVGSAARLVRTELTTRPARPIVALAAGTVATLWAVNFYVQPVSVSLGVPEARLGWLYAGFTLVGAAVSDNADRIRDAVGLRRWLVGFPVVVACALVLVAVVPLLAFPLFFLARGGRQLTTTLAGQYLNDRLDSAGRATVLSGLGMAISLGGATVQLSAGWLAQRLGPVTALGLFGLALAVLILLVRTTDRPFDDRVRSSRAD